MAAFLAYRTYGLILLKDHIYLEGYGYLDKALEIKPGNKYTTFCYGKSLLDKGDFDAARNCFENALNLTLSAITPIPLNHHTSDLNGRFSSTNVSTVTPLIRLIAEYLVGVFKALIGSYISSATITLMGPLV